MTGHKTGETVTVDFTTHSPTTGAATNADALPTGILVINGTDNGATVTVTNKSTGNYKAAVILPAVSDGDELQIRIAATVGTVASKAVVWTGAGITQRASDTYTRIGANGAGLTSVGLADGAITAAKIAANAFASAKFAADFFTSIVTAVWTTAATRTLTAFGFDVTLAAAQPNYAPAKAGDAMALTDGAITAAKIAANALSAAKFATDYYTQLIAGIEAELANDATGEQIKQQIIDKLIENLPDLDDLTLNAIAQAVWTYVTRSLTDKTGFSLATAPPTLAEIRADVERVGGSLYAVKLKTDQLTFNGTNVNANFVEFLDQDATPLLHSNGPGLLSFNCNVVAWGSNGDAIWTQTITERTIGIGGGIMKFVPLVASDSVRFGGYIASSFTHENAGLGAVEFHTHVHGFAAAALSEIRDELGTELTIINRYGAMISIVGAGPAYQFTTEALANAPTGGGGGAGGLTPEQDSKLETIFQKTSLITAGKTTIVSPVGPSGLVTLIQGFDWPTSDTAGVVFEEPYVAAWPAYLDSVSQHIMFAVKKDGTEEFTGTGEMLDPLGDGRRRLGYTIPKTELTDWPGRYEYFLGAVLASGNRVAFSQGELVLKRGPSI